MSDTIVMSADVKFVGQHLTHFRPDTQDEVCVVIIQPPSKSCKPDPLPTLLKVYLDNAEALDKKCNSSTRPA